MAPCIACAAGMIYECYQPDETTGEPNCPDRGSMSLDLDLDSALSEDAKLPGGQVKDDTNVTDIESTGRKRAALLYPLEEGMICEWSGLKLAGGGVNPIVGCRGNPAVARHHGPDKDTLNNEFGNVHRICAHCHNRWHTRNDEFYGERPSTGGVPFLPREGSTLSLHDRESKATLEEIMNSDLYWLTNRPKRAKD